MNLDQLPFTAFALEAAAGGAGSGGDGKTLTLPRRAPALLQPTAEHESMSGTVDIGAAGSADAPWRAAVVAAKATALTITF
jgi:hypothetical protein